MLNKEEIENIICNADFGEGKDKQVEQVWVNVSFLDHITAERNKYKDKVDHLESREQKLIEKLEKDIVNITKTMQDGKHCNNYSRCRLKAYRTKTKEILEILKKE